MIPPRLTNPAPATIRRRMTAPVPPQWPNECPPDLRPRLEEVLSMRSHGPAEIWGVVKDWLVANRAEAPDMKPTPNPFDPKR